MDASVALTVPEQDELAHCEAVIAQGLNTFMEVGQALLTVRDKRLYRVTHKTFAEYCRERWELGKTRAYQLMAAAEVTRDLSTIVDILPANEAQARPLTEVEPQQRTQAWGRAIEIAGGGQPTAAQVTEAVEEIRPTKRQHSILDTFTPDVDTDPADDVPVRPLDDVEIPPADWDALGPPDAEFSQVTLTDAPAPITPFPQPTPTAEEVEADRLHKQAERDQKVVNDLILKVLVARENIDPERYVRQLGLITGLSVFVENDAESAELCADWFQRLAAAARQRLVRADRGVDVPRLRKVQ